MEVLGPGEVRDRLQRFLVEPHVDRPAVDADGRAFLGAEAHGVDPDAALGGHPRRVERVGAGGAPAVGEQDDRGRRVGAGLDRLERLLLRLGLARLVLVERPEAPAVGRWPGAEQDRLEVDPVVREQRRERHDDGAADRGVALQLEPVDGAHEVLAVLRRRLHHRGGAGERHDREADVLRLVLDERLRGFLRGREPRRLDVGRAHAERHVERHDDDALLGRQRDDRARPRDREDRRDHREEEERRRDVAPEPLAGPDRLAHQTQARVPDRALLPPAQQQDVDADQHRGRQQQPQHLGPQKRHRVSPFRARGEAPVNHR